MKASLLLALLLLSPCAHACGDEDVMAFGGFYETPSPHAQLKGNVLTIDTSFLQQLVRNPTGENFEKDRNELLYLISINDKTAIHAGMAVLARLVNHPTRVVECDQEHELYGKEELAFVLSRSDYALDELCRLSSEDRTLVVDLYEKHKILWSNVDPPWLEGDLSCNLHEV